MNESGKKGRSTIFPFPGRVKMYFAQIFEKCENTGGYVNHKFTVFINVSTINANYQT